MSKDWVHAMHSGAHHDPSSPGKTPQAIRSDRQDLRGPAHDAVHRHSLLARFELVQVLLDSTFANLFTHFPANHG